MASIFILENKNDLVMVAMNNNERKMRIDPQRFYEVIKDRKKVEKISLMIKSINYRKRSLSLQKLSLY